MGPDFGEKKKSQTTTTERWQYETGRISLKHMSLFSLWHIQAPAKELFIRTHQHGCNDRDGSAVKMAVCFWSHHACNNAMLINVADWEQAISSRTHSLNLMFSHLQFPARFSALEHAYGIKRFPPPHQM